MDISELIKFQEEFDSGHISEFNWNEKITKDNLEILQFLIIGLMGEVGETANIVKKVIRGDVCYNSIKEEIKEELIDVFIYLIKLFNQMDIDIEKTYFEKMKKNKKKFSEYEINKSEI